MQSQKKPYETPLLKRLTREQAIAMWQRSKRSHDPQRTAWIEARRKLLKRIEGRPGWRVE